MAEERFNAAAARTLTKANPPRDDDDRPSRQIARMYAWIVEEIARRAKDGWRSHQFFIHPRSDTEANPAAGRPEWYVYSCPDDVRVAVLQMLKDDDFEVRTAPGYGCADVTIYW